MRKAKSAKRKAKKAPGKIFIISGPSGSGKTTLLKKVLLDKSLKKRLAKSVSLTTRPKRSGEREGKDYFFVKPQEFRRLNKAKKILERTRYLGYDYGTKKDFLEERLNKGGHLCLCLDLKGALALKRLYPENTVTVFINPPSINELRRRMVGRCSQTRQEEVNKRIKLAVAELKNSYQYDYSVKNKNLAEAERRLKGIILKEIGA